MQFFNIKFDPLFEKILKDFTDGNEIDILIVPIGSKVNTLENSRASIYKGKITELDIPAYILQRIQYTHILFIFFYVVELIYYLVGKTAPFFIQKIGLTLFEVLFIDHNILIYRTFGFYFYDADKNFYDHLSFLTSIIILLIQIHQLLRIFMSSKQMIYQIPKIE
jgi:hypothetical protein